jgi:hypothetical protein
MVSVLSLKLDETEVIYLHFSPKVTRVATASLSSRQSSDSGRNSPGLTIRLKAPIRLKQNGMNQDQGIGTGHACGVPERKDIVVFWEITCYYTVN